MSVPAISGCWIFEGVRGGGCFWEACCMSLPLRGSFVSVFFLLECYCCLTAARSLAAVVVYSFCRGGPAKSNMDRIEAKEGSKRAGHLVLVSFVV